MIRVIAVVSCLILARVAVRAQENAAGSERKTSIQTLYWSEKPDVEKWLTENETRLNHGDGCQLTSSWFDEKHPYPAGSVSAVASFVTVPEDEESTRVIHDPVSGLDVRVGVKYVSGGPGKVYLLQIALAFEGPPDGVFDEISRSEAESQRQPDWKWLDVVKPVRVGSMRYRFALHCENGRTFLSFLRGPRKKSRTAKLPPK